MRTVALFPGAFDPVHFGHINIAIRAAKVFDRLIVAVYENPVKNVLFSSEERVEMFTEAVRSVKNIEVTSYRGLTINYAAEVGAQVMVRGLRVFSDFDYEFRMALTNQELNPEIETVSFITNHRYTFISSTTVKEVATLDGDVSMMVPDFVAERMNAKLSLNNNKCNPL